MFEQTSIPDLILHTPNVHVDERGNFHESYNQLDWKKQGYSIQFIQDNQSESKKGVLRGLHYQLGEYSQTKLVRCILGVVQVAVVDMRKDSITYGKSFNVLLDDLKKQQLLVPKGFAHGFLTLSEKSIYSYKVDAYRVPNAEYGLDAFDAYLNIHWKLPTNEIKRKDADEKWPDFKNSNEK